MEYVTDSSKLSDDYARNFLRLDVLPLLEKINPSVMDAVVRTAENLKGVELLYQYALNEIIETVRNEDGSFRIDVIQNTPAPQTVLFELLRPYGFNRSMVKSIYQSLSDESGKRFFSASHQLVKDRDRLLMAPLAKETDKDDGVLIYPEDREILDPVKLFLHKRVLTNKSEISRDKQVATVDWSKLQFPLVLRRWRDGDWFVPFGMKGRKKIS